MSIPTNAIMGGFPWYAIEGETNKKFVDDFRKAYNKPPFTAAYFMLLNFEALEAGVRKAKSTDPEKLIDALAGIEFELGCWSGDRFARSTIKGPRRCGLAKRHGINR